MRVRSSPKLFIMEAFLILLMGLSDLNHKRKKRRLLAKRLKKQRSKSNKKAKTDFSVAYMGSELNMLQHEKVSEMKFKL